MRPRSRPLTAVNLEILNDVCFPSNITGKSIRVTLDGKKHEKAQLDMARLHSQRHIYSNHDPIYCEELVKFLCNEKHVYT
jgi:hypothetical protein